ncbi:unnamed protein product [Discosporangium mesarthrocarpum]
MTHLKRARYCGRKPAFLLAFLALIVVSTHGFIAPGIPSCPLEQPGARTFEGALTERGSPQRKGRVQGRKALSKDDGNGSKDKQDQTIDVQDRDWREFRMQLVRRFSDSPHSSHPNKASWTQDQWAHEIGEVERGCLLLATEDLTPGPWSGTTVLILDHKDEVGTTGLVFNRRSEVCLNAVAGLKPETIQVFGESKLYYGGPMGTDSIFTLHSVDSVDAKEIVSPQIFMGGLEQLTQLGKQGQLDRSQVKLIYGHASWGPGQLQEELDHQQWFLAAAAPELVTKAVDPNSSVWCQILHLMGGKYAEIAWRNGGLIM